MGVPSHISGMRCVFAQNHESERDVLILLSFSLSWFCAKTQRIPDTWDGTLRQLEDRNRHVLIEIFSEKWREIQMYYGRELKNSNKKPLKCNLMLKN